MTSKTTLAILAAGVAISACVPTTRDGLRKREATLTVESARSLSEITTCVLGIWEKRSGAIGNLPRPAGVTLTFGEPMPLILVDVTDNGATRHVVTHGPYSVKGSYNRRLVDEVRSCTVAAGTSA